MILVVKLSLLEYKAQEIYKYLLKLMNLKKYSYFKIYVVLYGQCMCFSLNCLSDNMLGCISHKLTQMYIIISIFCLYCDML